MVLGVEKLENSVVKIRIEIPKDEFNDGMYKAYLKQRGQYNLPGFRKGKAPKKIIENYYGEQVFYEDAVDVVFPDAYKAAIEEHNIDPVERPAVQVEQAGSDKNLIIVAEVTVRPEITVKKYKGVTIEKPEVKVAEKDIKAEVDKARENAARFVEVKRKVKDGDRVNLDYAGSVDGVPFDGGTAQGQMLVIGSQQFIPGFEEQLIGMGKDEEGDVKVTFPKQYHAPELAGKDAVFAVKINEIKEKKLPKFDDEFVKDVSEFDTVDEYKADIKARLEKDAAKAELEILSNNALDAVMEHVEVEVPKVMVDNEIGMILRDMEYRLKYQGIDMGTYLKITGKTVESLMEEYRDEAQRYVKARLTMEEIQKTEDIPVTDKMYEDYLNEKAAEAGKSLEEYKTMLGEANEESVKNHLKWQATIDFIIENGKLKKAAKAKTADENEADAKPATKKATAKKEEPKEEKAAKKPAAKKTDEKPAAKKPAAKKTTKKDKEESK